MAKNTGRGSRIAARALTKLSTRTCRDMSCFAGPQGWHTHHLTLLGKLRFTPLTLRRAVLHVWQSWPVYWHVGRRVNGAPFRLAHAMPRWLQYYVVNDVAARMTTRPQYGHRTPTDINIMELLEYSSHESALWRRGGDGTMTPTVSSNA